jgi:integrase
MGRPPLPLGTWGKIRRYQEGPALAGYCELPGLRREDAAGRAVWRLGREGGAAFVGGPAEPPAPSPKKPARSLTLDEVRVLRAGLRADEKAVTRDVPSLVDFMLGTGLRIGETLAVTWEALDLEACTVEVRGTVVRVRGAGLIIQPAPKTDAGWRTLHLPAWLVTLLKAREHVDNLWNVVFASQLAKLRDRSNTNADIRDALDPLGFGGGSPATRSGRRRRRCSTTAG